MRKILIFALICASSFIVKAQEATAIEHPVAKFLAKHKITAQYSLVVTPESRKELLKEIKKTPYLEVFNKNGVKVNYPSSEGHLIKSFFDPNDKTSIPMESMVPDTKVSNESILKRFRVTTLPDGSKIPTEVIQSPEKYYVALFWKKETKKRSLEILKNWTEYAAKNKEIKLLLINVD